MDIYYDETFHDRKITQTDEGILNSYLDNSNDCFIYAILGLDEESTQSQEALELENEIKKSLGLDKELKSTTFARRNFQYGLKSMRQQCKDFYYKFLPLIADNNTLFQIGMVSKTEFLLEKMFKSLRFPSNLPIVPEAFIYSLTKFIERHRLSYLFSEAFNQSNNNISIFKDKLVFLLEKVYIEIKDVSREKREAQAILEMLHILDLSKTDSKAIIDNCWDYSINAEGVKKRLKELNKLDTSVHIDREKCTCDAFVKAGLLADELDSKSSLQIRMTDMFVGFVGRFIWALIEDLKEPDLKTISDINRELYIKKRIISNEWFNIDEETFELYKKLGNFFSKSSYWSSFTMYYFDNALLFFSFFNYINSYTSYKDFVNNKGKHNEYYNTYCCNCLEERFKA